MINIQDIIPFMKKGWVAYDNGNWWWFSAKPMFSKRYKVWMSTGRRYIKLNTFEMKDISPADDWTKSLICIKVGGK